MVGESTPGVPGTPGSVDRITVGGRGESLSGVPGTPTVLYDCLVYQVHAGSVDQTVD